MKTVLITGATGAIGKATAMELARNNCRVILLGRNQDKLEAARYDIVNTTSNENIEIFQADLSEPRSIRKAVNEIRRSHASLNALINVAAVFKKQRRVNSYGYEFMFATNHLGPFILTNELLVLLKAGSPSRIITVSAPSFAKINFDDLHGKKKFSSGFTGSFGMSKMMNLMFSYALARRLEGTGVTASIFHPGLVKSDLMKNEMPALLNFMFKTISSKPDRAAKMLCSLAIDSKYQNSNGTFFKSDGKEIRSNKYSYDTELQEKLWIVSEQLVG